MSVVDAVDVGVAIAVVVDDVAVGIVGVVLKIEFAINDFASLKYFLFFVTLLTKYPIVK